MKNWRSISEIKDVLNLKHDATTVQVQNALVGLLKTVHPDATSGHFSTPDQEERYYLVKSALEFLEKNPVGSTGSDVALWQSSPLALSPPVSHEINRKLELNFRDDMRDRISRKVRPIKIGSASFAAICAGILTFSEKIVSNQLVSELISSISVYFPIRPVLGITVLAGLFISAGLFTSAFYKEIKLAQKIESAVSDQGIKSILQNYYIRSSIEENSTFGLDQLRAAIGSELVEVRNIRVLGRLPKRVQQISVLKPYRVSRSIEADSPECDRIAGRVLERLSMKGAIEKLQENTISERYKLSESARDEILN